MSESLFDSFFRAEARMFLLTAIKVAMAEDGPDLTSRALFADTDILSARIVAKEAAVVAGMPLIPMILDFGGEPGTCQFQALAEDGERVAPGAVLALIQGPAAHLLKAERVILNFLCHLSGIATLTARYVTALAGTRTRLLDTRKTLPGLRYPEKYAVLAGGGLNHRLNLVEMLMLKDNHIDRAGGITEAVAKARAAYKACPPIEVECRTLDEVREAVAAKPARIMLDNMDEATMAQALKLISKGIETEASGNVTLENIGRIGAIGPDFVSVGRITHSAPYADFSMDILRLADEPGDLTEAP